MHVSRSSDQLQHEGVDSGYRHLLHPHVSRNRFTRTQSGATISNTSKVEPLPQRAFSPPAILSQWDTSPSPPSSKPPPLPHNVQRRMAEMRVHQQRRLPGGSYKRTDSEGSTTAEMYRYSDHLYVNRGDESVSLGTTDAPRYFPGAYHTIGHTNSTLLYVNNATVQEYTRSSSMPNQQNRSPSNPGQHSSDNLMSEACRSSSQETKKMHVSRSSDQLQPEGVDGGYRHLLHPHVSRNRFTRTQSGATISNTSKVEPLPQRAFSPPAILLQWDTSPPPPSSKPPPLPHNTQRRMAEMRVHQQRRLPGGSYKRTDSEGSTTAELYRYSDHIYVNRGNRSVSVGTTDAPRYFPGAYHTIGHTNSTLLYVNNATVKEYTRSSSLPNQQNRSPSNPGQHSNLISEACRSSSQETKKMHVSRSSDQLQPEGVDGGYRHLLHPHVSRNRFTRTQSGATISNTSKAEQLHQYYTEMSVSRECALQGNGSTTHFNL